MVACNMPETKKESTEALFKNEKVYDSCKVTAGEEQSSRGYRMTIEPLMFTVTFVTTCTNGVTIDVIERNLFCQSQPENCSAWSRDNELFRNGVNAEAARINMYIKIVQGIFPLFISMFVGPWSDTNGRKPFMVSVLSGYLSYTLLWTVLTLFPTLSPYFFVIPSIPLSLSGGQLALFLCGYCYISDTTEPHNRTVRFSMMHSSSMVGNLFGTLCVIVVEHLSSSINCTYVITLSICSVITFLGMMHVLCFLEETVVRKGPKDFIFNMDFAKSVATCLFKKSPSDLVITLLTVFMLFFDISIKKGERVILYLVGLDQYSWSLSYFNFFSMSIIFISAITTAGVSIMLKKWLGWHNLTIILFAAIMVFSSEVLRAMSTSILGFWFMSALSTISALTAPAVNAEISTLASKEDMGKIYAFNALIDAFVPFIAISLYSEVYRFLVLSHSVLFVYLLSAGSAIFIGASSIVLTYLKPMKSNLITPIEMT